MSHIPIFTFFNNKGGVGKTTLVYHLSWMLSELGVKVLVVDGDPQANLTAAFLQDSVLESLWHPTNQKIDTLFKAVEPLLDTGDYQLPEVFIITKKLGLIAGDISLSTYEDSLSEAWSKATSERAIRPMRQLSAFWRLTQVLAKAKDYQIILFDVAPSLGALNRSILIGSDYVITPLAGDIFSIQGLKNLGLKLERWRKEWETRVGNLGDSHTNIKEGLPNGTMLPLGYIAQQYQQRLDRPVKAYERWFDKVPLAFSEHLLKLSHTTPSKLLSEDEHCLASIPHYKSLIPFGQSAKKPIFKLGSADGVSGVNQSAVRSAYNDFQKLTERLLSQSNLSDLLLNK